MNQLATMALSFVLGTVLATTPYSTASLNMAPSHITGVVDSPEAFSISMVGPGLDDLSIKDGYAFYQWTLHNDGQVRRIERKLDIKTVDPIINMDENGMDSISLPPLGPSNFEALTTDTAKGIDINIRPAWEFHDQLETRRLVVVAVIDTGIGTTHPDFKDSIWVNEDEIPGDGIDNDGNGYIDDVNGRNLLDSASQPYVEKEDNRGTHAVGTIAASCNNGGIAEINDGQYVKIMSLEALSGGSGRGSPESVIAAIRYVEANDAQICSLSFGSENYIGEFMAVVQNSKILSVMAVGNGGESGKGYNIDRHPAYPASPPSDNMITVTNLTFDDKLDRSSSYGPVNVDLAAPGCFIPGTISDHSYAFMTSISMATPMVTGAAAMAYPAKPDLGPIGVKSVLPISTKKLGTLNGRVFSGGMLDVYSALQ